MSGIKFRWIMLGLVAFFPYAFQHLVDTGPIGFDITSIFLIVYCIDRWLATQSARYPIACALLVFCGIWTKLVYFWFVPGLAILFLYACIGHWATVRKHALRLGIQAASASVLLIVLLSLLLFSTAPGNSAVHPFLSQLAGSEATPLSQYLRGGFLSSPVVQSLANPYQAIQRVFDVPLPSYFSLAAALLFYCSLPFIAVVLLMLKAISGTQLRTVFVQYVAFLATIMMIGRTPLAMFMHHAVLSLPFLILAVVTLLGSITLSSARQLMLIPALAFVSVNLFFYGTFSAQPIRSSDDPSKLELHAVLRDPTIARDYFMVITDWGMYYYQGLYGDHAQSVLYVQPLNKETDVGRLLLMSAEHKRSLLFVFNSKSPESDLELIRSSFNVKPCSAIDETAVWQMLIEDDGNPKNPCFQPPKPTRPSAIERLKELAW